MTLRVTRSVAAAAVALAMGLGTFTVQPSATTVLAVPERSNAYASIASAGSFVAIVWGATKEGATDVFAATSRDGGRTFGLAVSVSNETSRANPAGEQPPRVALVPRSGRDPALVVVWTSKTPTGTRLMTARSDDGGRAFAEPAVVAGSEAPGNRGWTSLAADRQGRVVLVWLDHRELAAGSPQTARSGAPHAHAASSHHEGDNVARAQKSKLYVAWLHDSSSPRAITGGVCYCCKTSVAVGPDGSVHAAWRHVYPRNIRDIATIASRDGGRTFSAPARVSEDSWALDGCPENGPSIAVDAQGHAHVVWPTLTTEPGAREPTLSLFYSSSADGQRFSPRLRLPTVGVARHAQVVLATDGDVAVVWDEEADASRRVAFASGARAGDGTMRFTRRVLGDRTRGVYPVVASTPDGLVAAWSSGPADRSVVRVERLTY